MPPLPGGRKHCLILYGTCVPVAVRLVANCYTPFTLPYLYLTYKRFYYIYGLYDMLIGVCGAVMNCYVCEYDNKYSRVGQPNCKDPFNEANITSEKCSGECQVRLYAPCQLLSRL